MRPMRDDTRHVLLLLLGGALVRIAADDTFLRYVRPAHRWWLIGAGAVLVVLAATALVHRRNLPSEVAGHHGHDGPAGHAAWALLLPVLVIVTVAPPALGADAVARGPSGDVRTVATALPAGPLQLPVAEVVGRSAGGGTLDERDVTVVGFLARDDGQLLLARMTITCCAADARPYALRLAGPGAAPVAGLPGDTWLRVRGRVSAGSATRATRYRPELTVAAAEPVPAPADPYEY